VGSALPMPLQNVTEISISAANVSTPPIPLPHTLANLSPLAAWKCTTPPTWPQRTHLLRSQV